MPEKLEGTTSSQEDEDKEQQVKLMIEGFSDEDRELFEKYIQLPNQANIQPEVMRLVMEYGEKFSQVSDRVEEMRQKLGMNYDDLRKEILDQLGK